MNKKNREPQNNEALSQQEVADILGTSRNNIGQIERKALRKLRQSIASAEIVEEFKLFRVRT